MWILWVSSSVTRDMPWFPVNVKLTLLMRCFGDRRRWRFKSNWNKLKWSLQCSISAFPSSRRTIKGTLRWWSSTQTPWGACVWDVVKYVVAHEDIYKLMSCCFIWILYECWCGIKPGFMLWWTFWEHAYPYMHRAAKWCAMCLAAYSFACTHNTPIKSTLTEIWW